MNSQKNYLKNKIFDRYHSIHGKFLGRDIYAIQKTFDEFCKFNLLKYLPHDCKTRILEIGSHKGFILKWLENSGFQNIEGIDLSPEDVKFSIQYVKTNKKIFCVDGFDYLPSKKNEYDLIISKAVLEHIPKNKLNKFLKLIHKSLKKGGRIIICVPNMDWIMAQHERYMDITHEVGFTKESLAELLRLYFDDVTVSPAFYEFPHSIKNKIRINLLKPITRKLIRLLLKILGEGAGDCWFEHRAIIGSGIKK